MSQPSDHQSMDRAYNDAAFKFSGQVMIAAVIFLFMVVVFVYIFYLCAKYYMGSNLALRLSRSRFFAAADQIPVARRGLDAEVLKSLPISIFKPSELKDGLECAVCLSELSEGEKIRILPKCNHGFHVDCIDMWFHSHTTCPLCRAPLTGDSESMQVQPQEGVSATGYSMDSPNFQDQVTNGVPHEGTSSSSSSKKPEGMLVIDIPVRAMEEIVSPLPTSKFPAEEAKTPKSARLRSLGRLLSRGKMVIGSSCSPKGGDIEQGVLGEGSSSTPKTPTSK